MSPSRTSPQLSNVIIVGASGNLGPYVISALEKAGGFNVSVLSRAESKTSFPEHVTVHKSDYSHASLVEAFTGKDAVVCTIGGAALGEQEKLINAAVEAGVKRFLPSEFGNDTENPKAIAMVPFFAPKKPILDLLRKKEADGLSWTGVTTGVFFDWAMKVSFLGFNVQKQQATIFDDGNGKFCGTLIETVAETVPAVLSRPAETENKLLYVASLDSTQNEVLAALEKHAGKKYEVTKVTVADQQAQGMAAMQKGDFGAAVTPLILSGVYSGAGANFGHKLDNALLGLPEPSLSASLKPVFDHFDNAQGGVEVPEFADSKSGAGH